MLKLPLATKLAKYTKNMRFYGDVLYDIRAAAEAKSRLGRIAGLVKVGQSIVFSVSSKTRYSRVDKIVKINNMVACQHSHALSRWGLEEIRKLPLEITGLEEIEIDEGDTSIILAHKLGVMWNFGTAYEIPGGFRKAIELVLKAKNIGRVFKIDPASVAYLTHNDDRYLGRGMRVAPPPSPDGAEIRLSKVEETFFTGSPWISAHSWGVLESELSLAFSENRTILLAGPSGTGKTSSAARAALMGKADTILAIVSGDLLESGSHFILELLKELISIIGVTHVIIDDINPRTSIEVLSSLDSLHGTVSVAITVMLPQTMDKEDIRLTGLRPGRVDRFYWFSPPNIEARADILEAYYLQFSRESNKVDDELDEDTLLTIAEQTEGLTPAYLREFMYRFSGKNEDLIQITNSLLFQHKVAN